MLIIQDILISDALLQEQFTCKLDACKGACCWEGDFGAPLEPSELETLRRIYPQVKPFLRPEGIAAIEENGLYTLFEQVDEYGTALLEDGACVYMTYDDNGIAQCGIEQAYKAGKTDYRKPISCHLYPVRVREHPESGFTALNYDQWDICSAACSLGKALQMPVYRFVKEGLVRKFGAAFYEELEAAAQHLEEG